MQEWLREQTTHSLDGGAEGVKILAHGLKGGQRHKAGEGQGELGEHSPGLDGNESSTECQQPVHGNRHILVIGAHHADVVAVMTNRGGERALAKAKALDETVANVAVTAVAFEHADLEQVVLRICMPSSLAIGQISL